MLRRLRREGRPSAPPPGSDDPTNLITLCSFCHLKLHGRRNNGSYNASQQVKAALQAAKARGVKLGGPLGAAPLRAAATPETRAKGAASTAERAKLFVERLAPALAALSHLSANAAAKELADRGIATANGGKWSAGKVIALRKRLAS